MTVELYSARFMELARFTANLIPDEESKVERFENGLNPRIKERVICHEIKDYARLVEVASLAERGIRESATAYNLKRRLKQETSYSEKRLVIESDSKLIDNRNFWPALGNQKPLCDKCGKPRGGECRMTNPSCFKCGKPGHVQKYCPMNSTKESKPQGGESRQQYPAQALVYSLIPDGAEEDEEYIDATAGTIL
jgi:hypothetical protein